MLLQFIDIIKEKRINTHEDDVYKEFVINDNEETNNGLCITVSSRDEKKIHTEFEKIKNRKVRITIEIC